jgi:hypothetical protein
VIFAARTEPTRAQRHIGQAQLALPMNDVKLPVTLTLNKIILCKPSKSRHSLRLQPVRYPADAAIHLDTWCRRDIR